LGATLEFQKEMTRNVKLQAWGKSVKAFGGSGF
jgi:hypothetical protein